MVYVQNNLRCQSHAATYGSHLLLILVVIVIVITVVSWRRGCSLRSLSGVGLLLFLLLHFGQGFPFLRELVGLGLVVGNDDVVEDGAALDLPEIEADEAKILEGVEAVVVFMLRVGDLLGLPDALIVRVG